MADSVVLSDGILVNAPERADRLVKLLNAAGILNEHFDIFKSNIAAELEAYAEEKHKNCMGAEVEGCATWVRIERLETAKAEGRRAGLEEAAEYVAENWACSDCHSHLNLPDEIRALITKGPAGAIEANEGEKK